jgi:hypothetical protein
MSICVASLEGDRQCNVDAVATAGAYNLLDGRCACSDHSWAPLRGSILRPLGVARMLSAAVFATAQI